MGYGDGGYFGGSGAYYGSYDDAYNNRDTYDRGYLFTSDKTGGEIGSAASAVGSFGSMLTGLFFGNQQLKMQHRMENIQHQQIRDQFKDRMKDSSLGEMGALRQFQRGTPDAMAQLAAQGQGNSSAANQAKADMDYALQARLSSIQRERALAVGGMKAQEEIWKLQRKMERSQRTAAMISAGIDTAVSLAKVASDQRIKKNFGTVDAQDILAKLESLPVTTWTYEWERDDVKHMGPMAQDFHRIFGLGEPIKGRPASIAHVDLFGVMLASIKALSSQVNDQNERIHRLETVLVDALLQDIG